MMLSNLLYIFFQLMYLELKLHDHCSVTSIYIGQHLKQINFSQNNLFGTLEWLNCATSTKVFSDKCALPMLKYKGLTNKRSYDFEFKKPQTSNSI